MNGAFRFRQRGLNRKEYNDWAVSMAAQIVSVCGELILNAPIAPIITAADDNFIYFFFFFIFHRK